jgi:hypothetical protein
MALRPVVAKLIERAALRLWQDDLAYAERLFTLREQRRAAREGEAAQLEVVSSRGTP